MSIFRNTRNLLRRWTFRGWIRQNLKLISTYQGIIPFGVGPDAHGTVSSTVDSSGNEIVTGMTISSTQVGDQLINTILHEAVHV